MVVSKKHKIVFVAIPKTATRSVYQYFYSNLGGHIVKEHLTTIPSQFENYYSFLIVRNPYDRVISAWWSTMKRGFHSKKYIKITQHILKGDYSFLNFCKNLDSINKLSNFIVAQRQMDWIKNNSIDKILKFETLNAEWLTLPFNNDKIELTTRNATTHVGTNNPIARLPYVNYLTSETIQLVNDYYACDFDNLKYDYLK